MNAGGGLHGLRTAELLELTNRRPTGNSARAYGRASPSRGTPRTAGRRCFDQPVIPAGLEHLDMTMIVSQMITNWAGSHLAGVDTSEIARSRSLCTDPLIRPEHRVDLLFEFAERLYWRVAVATEIVVYLVCVAVGNEGDLH